MIGGKSRDHRFLDEVGSGRERLSPFELEDRSASLLECKHAVSDLHDIGESEQTGPFGRLNRDE